ncbi:MAG TPA: hypothetical protein ENI56_01410 [Candidatus Kaiserbacteria bacterium]|nr:hypothetical protein [Candidatus Kaiserbacteria bacterium]
MSEKPPENPNTPDNNPPNDSETGPISAHGNNRIESARFNRISSCMGQGAVDSFMEMTDRGKEIIGDAYEKLYDVPVINRVVGKIGVAYKSFWADGHEKKAASRKAKMDGLDMSMTALNQASQDLSAVIDNLKQQHTPGSEALQLKLKVIERQKVELQNKKGGEQTKFEVQSNAVKMFTNERDAIADKLIGRYEEKLAPLEGGLDKLQHNRDHIEMEFSALNIRNQEVSDGIKKIDEQKTKMEEGLKLAGMSDRAIRNFPAVKTLDGIMASRRTNMRTERERLTKRRNDIENKIAKADKKANPYRDKRAEFVRAKQGRPIDMGVETRSRERDVTAHEDISTNIRQEQPMSETEPQNNQSGTHETERRETNEADERPPNISSHVSDWNNYLDNKYGKDKSPILVNMENFFAETGLTPVNTANKKDFGDVLVKYYKYNRTPAGSFEKDVDDYINNYASK